MKQLELGFEDCNVAFRVTGWIDKDGQFIPIHDDPKKWNGDYGDIDDKFQFTVKFSDDFSVFTITPIT